MTIDENFEETHLVRWESFLNIWPVFCPNGSRGERVWGHNCLLSRMITHGYLRLPRDHPRLPRAATQGSSCGVIQIFREAVYGTSGWQRQRQRQRHAVHDVERGGVGRHYWVVSLLSCSTHQPLLSSPADSSKSSLSSAAANFPPPFFFMKIVICIF